jgi:hypothetical protein
VDVAPSGHRDSASSTPNTCAGSALDCGAGRGTAQLGTEAIAIVVGAVRGASVLETLTQKGQNMGGDMLIFKPVIDLAWDDVVCDEYGCRRIIEIKREISGSYIEFDHGPSNWFHNAELFPVEVMS